MRVNPARSRRYLRRTAAHWRPWHPAPVRFPTQADMQPFYDAIKASAMSMAEMTRTPWDLVGPTPDPRRSHPDYSEDRRP